MNTESTRLTRFGGFSLDDQFWRNLWAGILIATDDTDDAMDVVIDRSFDIADDMLAESKLREES
jgi:hypothetical protein